MRKRSRTEDGEVSNNGEFQNNTRLRSPSISTGSNGEICIGDSCFAVRVAKNGNVEIEATEDNCTEEQRASLQRIKETLAKGAGTEYVFKGRKNGGKTEANSKE